MKKEEVKPDFPTGAEIEIHGVNYGVSVKSSMGETAEDLAVLALRCYEHMVKEYEDGKQ